MRKNIFVNISEVSRFCYLMFFVLLVSCNNTGSKKTGETEGEINIQEKKLTENRMKNILFFGNSLTAGMGLEEEEAFPALIQRKIDSLPIKYKVINAGLSGETTASGKNRLSWVLNQKVDVFVLELGANDGLRGIPLSETRTNLQEIIDKVRAHNSETKILLAGMQIPPNMGHDYTEEFKLIFPRLAEKNDISLVPFLLKDVAGIPELNQPDGIHPTAEGQKIVAENVWSELRKMLD